MKDVKQSNPLARMLAIAVIAGEITWNPAAAGAARGQAVPPATDSHGGFALPDPEGHRLLLMPNVARPELFTVALCSGGRRVPVQFEHRQSGTPNNGRQTSSNFDRLAGSVFAVSGGAVESGAPCFLPSEALMAGSALLNVTPPDGSGLCGERDRFARLHDRPVLRCWPLARLGSGRGVALLEFERRGNDALASLVLIDGSRAILADFPAAFRGPGQDLWRVDDAGVLSPEGLRIVCALQRGNWYALGVAWAGAEGQSLSLWVADGTDRFTKVIGDYWYQASHAFFAATPH